MAKSAPQSPNTLPNQSSSESQAAEPVKPELSRRKKAARAARNTTISVVVILLLLVGAGVAYTWYMGKQVVVTPAVLEAEEQKPVIERVQPAENVPVGVSVQSMTSPIVPGDNVTIIAKTRPFATCTILVEYNKVPSTDSGLKQKAADDFGVVTWTWTVEPSVPVGKWPVKVTCAYKEKSGTVQADLEVKQSLDQ